MGANLHTPNEQPTAPSTLIVDDNPIVARATELVFRQAGIPVVVAHSASGAAALWRHYKDAIALLVTDYNLGDAINGEQLFQLFLREKPSLRSIIVSAYPLSRELIGRAQGVDFFQKPWNATALVAAARRLLAEPQP